MTTEPADENKYSKKELYQKALELRKFEIENFWKRVLFFWGTIAIILNGYLKMNDSSDYLIFISFLGLIFNLIFSLSIRGSKSWQENWEIVASKYEKELGFKLLEKGNDNQLLKSNQSVFTKLYRFSVSKLTMLLSDISVIVWISLWGKDIFNLFSSETLNFNLNHKINFLVIVVLFYHIVIVLYTFLFFKNGKVFHQFYLDDETNKKKNSCKKNNFEDTTIDDGSV